MSSTNTQLWIPLHVHSEYSAYDGAIRIADYLKYAEENNLPAAAVSDHFTMSSFPEFDQKFSAAGIKAIYGNELYSGTLFADGISRVEKTGRKRFHLNSFAMNSVGLKNLQRLAAAGYKTSVGSAKGPYNITREALENYHDGILFSSACISGELPMLISAGKDDDAKEWLAQIQSIVGADNFYIEILDINYREQDELNKKLLDFARKHNVKTLLTTDSHYMPGDEYWYNYLLAAQKRKQEGASDDLNPQQKIFGVTDIMDLSLRSPRQIWEKWKNICPEAVLETVRLAERCEKYTVKGDKYMMPHKDFGDTRPFREEAVVGLCNHLDELGIVNRGPYMERLERELDVVTNMGFVDYFRFVSRLVNKCREDGIYVGPGRGSAAGSVLTWSLGITSLDPLEYGLLFERFLNPERVTMPDIDIDFEDERRGDVIKKLKEDYGEENVVAITNYSRCKWKVAIRDVMRVMNFQPWQSNEFVKLLEDKIDTGFDAQTDTETDDSDKDVTADDLIGCIRGKAQAVSRLQIEPEAAEKILKLSGCFNNLIRNYGKHASGIVICPGPAQDYMPLGRVNDVVVTQYDMKGVDYRKLVKVDILGLSTLSMIREMETTANLISPNIQSPTIHQFMTFINRFGKLKPEELENFEKPLKAISKALTPESIVNAYNIFRNAQTTGVFQFASPGMRRLLSKILPDNMEDLSAAVALYRPGPLKSGIAEHYTNGCIAERKIRTGNKRKTAVQQKATESPIDKLPEKARAAIREIAKDAKGEMIYQEHIMAAARHIAGYSLGEADILRKAMGKKDKLLMAEERRKFTSKAVMLGWEEEEASSVFDAIEYFAGYGFNKSHSFCYAALAFITSWYAANRKAVFWAALINDTAKKSSKDAAGHITLSPIIREAQENMNIYPPAMPEGIDYLSEDAIREINIAKGVYIGDPEEKIDWTNPKDFNVFLGLSSIKGTGSSFSGLKKLASLRIDGKDTIEDVFRKSLTSEEETALGQASQYFRNGFFDIILSNTIKKHNVENLLPVYLRLAIIELADTSNIDAAIRNSMIKAVTSLTRRNQDMQNMTLPFKIVKSRCVWGSFIADVSTRVRNKLTYKKNPWIMEDADRWIASYFTPVVDEIIKRAIDIRGKMCRSPEYKIQKYLDIYRLEKNAYGESFTLPDWTVAAEMTGYSAVFYADQAYDIRREIWARSRDEEQELRISRQSDYIDMLLAPDVGIWVIGQYGTAAWKGDGSGYIRLDGRYGQKNASMYVSTKEKLPFITLENSKKVTGMGGMLALKVYYDRSSGKFSLCENVQDKLPQEFKCGFEALSDAIAILPLTTMCSVKLPFMLPYKNKKLAVWPDSEQRDSDAQKIVSAAYNREKETVWGTDAELYQMKRTAKGRSLNGTTWKREKSFEEIYKDA